MNFLKPLLPTLAAVILAVGVSHADFFYRWSTVAGNNANSDTFTWAEGQAPSTVNDSARGLMAALAKFRDDTSGKLITAGTSTVYTLATNSVFNTLAAMDGAMLSFRMNVTSGAAPTLNVDGLGAKAFNQATGVAVATGALINGAIYRATYVNASNEWIVQGVAGAVPSGTTMLSVSTACPTGWTISATNNDKALVISSSAGGTAAGTTAFSTYFGGAFTSGGTAITQAQVPSYNLSIGGLGVSISETPHSHTESAATLSNSGAANAATGAVLAVNQNTQTTASALTGITASVNGSLPSGGSGSTHNHTIPSVQNVTAIACTKD